MQLAAPLGACVACGSGRIRHWKTKAFQYSSGSDEHMFQIDRCDDCNSGFLNPPPSVDALEDVYATSGHGLQVPVSSADVLAREAEWPNSTLDARRMVAGAVARVGSSAPKTALDVGSGFGFCTQALVAAGFDTTAINPGAYENAVFVDINGFEPVPVMLDRYREETTFGVIMMSQVLEHIVEPIDALVRIRKMLDADAVVVCAVPNFSAATVKLRGVRDDACLWVPEHVNYFTPAGLSALLERAGFDLLGSEQTTRIRPDAFVRRLPRWIPARPLRALVELGQRPVAGVLDRVGRGVYMTAYATPTA